MWTERTILKSSIVFFVWRKKSFFFSLRNVLHVAVIKIWKFWKFSVTVHLARNVKQKMMTFSASYSIDDVDLKFEVIYIVDRI